jgi:ATP-dependent RNA helicase DeaD
MEVALAAVKLAHEAGGAAVDQEEIPEVAPRPRREAPAGRDRRRGRPPSAGTTRLFVGAGRHAGIRPQDLVGAIAGESSLSGRDIGAIEIADRYSLVEVPESAADEVIAALRRTRLKGNKVTVRRER